MNERSEMNCISRMVRWFSIWKRHRFGMWTITIDRETGFYIITNYHGGVQYVEGEGQAKAGEPIELPQGCRNLLVIHT